ncbi:MAG: hypothetical protein AAF846_22760 [Chloroflexota bacterium]
MSTELRKRIRTHIQPFQRQTTYPTGWGGEMTFKEIEANIRPRAAKLLLCKFRVWPQDLDDCLQNGLMFIWMQLAEDREFLANMSGLETAIQVCYRSKSSSIYKQNIRYEFIQDFYARSMYEYPEERHITGLEWRKLDGDYHAVWSVLADIRLDFERAVLTVYEEVKDDDVMLLAFYAATTSVTCKSLEYIIEGRSEEAIRWRAVEIRNRLAELLNNYKPTLLTWREKYEAGHVQPAMELLDQHEHRLIRYDAIRALIDGKSIRKAAREYGYNENTFANHCKKAKKLLIRAYGCVA